LLFPVLLLLLLLLPAVRGLMRICGIGKEGSSSCGFFGSGGYLLYEITEGQVMNCCCEVSLVYIQYSFLQVPYQNPKPYHPALPAALSSSQQLLLPPSAARCSRISSGLESDLSVIVGVIAGVIISCIDWC
jgi:hypothetical protein